MTRLDRVNNLLNDYQGFKEKQKKEISYDEKKDRIKNWCTIYRRNWDIYVEKELGVKLKWFQQVAMYLICISDVFFFFCSRGNSKSFLSALASVVQCMIYPDSEVVLTATTIKTAKKFVEKKIEGELCTKFSPKLKYLYKKGLIKFKYDQEEIRVSFEFNRSWIIVLPETASSLGERITTLVCEEARQSKLSVIDRVFSPMRHARNPQYRNNPIYEGDERLVEKAKTIYLTSVSFRHEPIWKRWVDIVEGTFNNHDDDLGVYNIFIGDVYTALYHQFMTRADYMTAKNTSSDIEFRMEYLNESPVEGDGSFYEYKMFMNNAIISNTFLPPTYDDWIYKYKRGSIPYFREKQEDEKRAVYVDFAFNDSVKEENDLTVVGCMSGYPDENYEKYLKNIEYMETLSGGAKDESILRIRELFFLYEGDYLVIDTRNGGADRVRDLTKPYFHEQMGLNMRGFSFSRDEELTNNFYSKDKLEKMRERVVDSDPMECIILVAGTDERNDSYHRKLKDNLLDGSLRLLKDSNSIKREWEDDGTLLELTSEEMAFRLYPHIQIELMISEAVQLEKKLIKGAYTKLFEVGSNTKDKIVATEYSNYLFYLLEERMAKEKHDKTADIDWDKLRLVF